MSGKFQICSQIIISLLVLSSVHGAAPENGVSKDKLIVNGFDLKGYGRLEMEGLRNKAVADLYYKQGLIARAIKYYEQAAKLLPNEADIYLSMGDIYQRLDLYSMAAIYFKIAVQKYELPENFGKTQKFKYLALIWLARSYEKTRAVDDGHKKAEEIVAKLQKDHEKEIKESYPDVYAELNSLYSYVIGNVLIPEPVR